MKKILGTGILCLACLPALASAQEEETQSYVYATYLYCDVTRQDEADKIVETVDKPVLDALVADGTITGWGWLAHHTGGKWRRIRYHTAGSMAELLGSLDKIGEAMEKAAGDDNRMGAICNQHEDYIWRSVAGSEGATVDATRGKAGLSVYHKCKMSKEGRADEIVKTVFAPIYDAHLGEGKLASWGWSEHIVGGKYRRLSTMTADDWPTLLKVREEIFKAMDEQDNPLAEEFTEICGSHSDYLWEIQHES